jgi:hypothetical protein
LAQLSRLSDLQTLKLCAIPNGFFLTSLKYLREVSLSGSVIDDELIRYLSLHTNIIRLNIDGCSVSQDLTVSPDLLLTSLSALEMLSIPRTLCPSLVALSRLRRLRVLSWRHENATQLSGLPLHIV